MFTLFIGWIGQAQQGIIEPVKWDSKIEKVSDTEYDIILIGTIDKEWHVFSQFTDEDGSLPSVLTFENSGRDYELLGEAKESETAKAYNDVFEVEETYFLNKVQFTQRIKLLSETVKQINVHLEYQVCKEVCINKEENFVIALDGGPVTVENVALDERSIILSNKLTLDLKNKDRLNAGSEVVSSGGNLWKIFVLGFLGGLVALLTPCVFPMIPLTVSFFTKQSGTKSKGIRNAIVYGLFIVLIYVGLSIPFHFLDSVDPEILNTISTNMWLNVIFFVIFIFFAFSFFGYYELTLPSSWSNKMDSASSTGGIIGIFFMAITLALVSFSCTGPILGSLLAGSLTSDGGAFQLTAGMTGFGAALALPFALFALFPNLLKSLPKSGGWLTMVKVLLGFVELALAFKFLSNADLVAHWGILKREVFIGIWMLIFLLMALYFFGIIRFPHDGKKTFSFPKVTFAVLVVAFVIYLGTGLTKNSHLKLLAGFPPPTFYSLYEQESDCPLGLDCFKDFDEGLAFAKANNKPILLDFTGWACVNCRKMEENVWSDSKVYDLLKENYVLISLYVDDRKELSEAEQFKIKLNENHLKLIETVGDKWSTFQYLNFQTASQPYYVIMNSNLEILNEAKQYTGIDEYYEWLATSLKYSK
ncbi:thiol:disulfide interchange protein DsbD [Aquaticitalea lipolytica]|uniref:Thiol:disulfide interchange protein DsbD n=2 Tax=Aquaticitalea lipolytica TaxID=1247562 RepID=A0A8J2XII6_9FLAO|nr:thiol:disulfide interchange protein DsbD [Aquaticitalea lipolytica]